MTTNAMVHAFDCATISKFTTLIGYVRLMLLRCLTLILRLVQPVGSDGNYYTIAGKHQPALGTRVCLRTNHAHIRMLFLAMCPTQDWVNLIIFQVFKVPHIPITLLYGGSDYTYVSASARQGLQGHHLRTGIAVHFQNQCLRGKDMAEH